MREKVRKRGASLRNTVTPASVNRETQVLKRIFDLAVREGVVDRNPCWKVQALKENNKRNRVISYEQFQLLLGALPGYAADVVRIAYWTGMRAEEILGLTWDRVSPKDRSITLQAEDTKTQAPRTVYLKDELIEVFYRRAKVRPIAHTRVLTFPSSNRPLTTIRHSFRRACREVGLEDFRFHDLRHCFVTNMRKAGNAESVITKMTGHRSRSMFDRYNTVDREEAADASGRLEDFFANSRIVPNGSVELDKEAGKC